MPTRNINDMEVKRISKDEALEFIAEVKGEFHSMCNELHKDVELSKIMLTKLDLVQLYIDPDCDLNAIQTKVNRERIERRKQ